MNVLPPFDADTHVLDCFPRHLLSNKLASLSFYSTFSIPRRDAGSSPYSFTALLLLDALPPSSLFPYSETPLERTSFRQLPPSSFILSVPFFATSSFFDSSPTDLHGHADSKPKLVFRSDGSFKVVSFSDLHFGEAEDQEWGLRQVSISA